MSNFPRACPDLHYIDEKIRVLKDELCTGYKHPAATGYTIIEINDHIEDHRERYMRYNGKNPSELAQYLVEREINAMPR